MVAGAPNGSLLYRGKNSAPAFIVETAQSIPTLETQRSCRLSLEELESCFDFANAALPPPNMLPAHFSHEDGKRRPTSRPGSPLTRILRVLDDPHLRRHARQRVPPATIVTVVLLSLFFLLRLSFDSAAARPRRYTGDLNWGDHIALGLGRAKLLDETPLPYADLGDKLIGGTGPLYRAGRRSRREAEGEVREGKEGTKAAVTRDTEFERDRHGVLGGASVQWSSGIVGMGDWLGETVDMRKDSPEVPTSDSPAPLAARLALTRHILEKGWVYLDAEDQENTEKMLAEAVRDNTIKNLPLRDQVRGDEVASREAAEGWSRIYGAMEGEGRKSALEISVERLVRRVPVVVFSKTTCP